LNEKNAVNSVIISRSKIWRKNLLCWKIYLI